MNRHVQMRLIGAPPELSDAEHLALALEFFDPRCGEEYLTEHAPELLGEFERLSEGEGA